uniref:Uncharacterized protein n=1 Tax=Arundo donax TaxID=35708 RepID=A0A0A9B113_ARUDO
MKPINAGGSPHPNGGGTSNVMEPPHECRTGEIRSPSHQQSRAARELKETEGCLKVSPFPLISHLTCLKQSRLATFYQIGDSTYADFVSS